MIPLILGILLTSAICADDYRAEVSEHHIRFFQAAKSGNVTDLKAEVMNGVSLSTQDSKGYTALIYAAYHGQESMVDFLLNEGANPCQKDHRGNTALMGAIFKGNLAIALKLMRAECSVHGSNHAAQTPLMYASLFGRTQIAKELLSKGADSELTDDNGFSAKSLAEGQDNQEMLLLLESK